MASAVCFNCGSSNHISVHCTEPQKYSRCGVCKNVCFTEGNHKLGCSNKNFRSIFKTQDDNVAEISEILRIDFQMVDIVLAISSRGEKQVSQTPLWFGNASLLLRENNGGLCFEAAEDGKRTITIVDENNERRIKIFIAAKVLVINDYYTFTSNGGTKYNRSYEQNVKGNSECELKVYTNGELFKVRIFWNGMANYFHVYPRGICLRDPLEKQLQRLSKEDKKAAEGKI